MVSSVLCCPVLYRMSCVVLPCISCPVVVRQIPTCERDNMKISRCLSTDESLSCCLSTGGNLSCTPKNLAGHPSTGSVVSWYLTSCVVFDVLSCPVLVYCVLWWCLGLVFKAHRLLYHSTLGLRVTKKREEASPDCRTDFHPSRVSKWVWSHLTSCPVLVQGHLAHKKRRPPRTLQ